MAEEPQLQQETAAAGEGAGGPAERRSGALSAGAGRSALGDAAIVSGSVE